MSLYKISNDLRWMGSGPRAGLGEIRLPDLQPGSSIMPGKVNPVIPEALCMVCAQVIGNDAAIAFGGAAGNFELNVMLPMLARNVLESIRLLANVSRLFADRCIDGITANEERAGTSPSRRRRSSRRSTATSGTRKREGREAVAQGGQDHPAGRARARATSSRASSPRSSSTRPSTCCA